MGYLITSHITTSGNDLNLIQSLPQEIAFKAYHVKGYDGVFLDFYSVRKESQYPFQQMLPATGLLLELPDPYQNLNTLYEALKTASAANSFKRELINLNLKLSASLGSKVFSFASDDDEIDISVQSDSGSITKLRFQADDIEITFFDGEIHIYPLLTEEEEEILDLSVFEDGPFTIHPRDREYDSLLHSISSEEVKLFLNTDQEVLGLSNFNPPEYELEEFYSYKSESTPENKPKSVKKIKPWWKFWRG